MKDTLHYLDTIELHAPNFDWDIDGGTDSPAAMDKDIPSRHKPTPPTEHESIDYQLSPLLSDWTTPILGIFPPFHFSINKNKIDTVSMVQNAT